jgi:hypothetical protein
MSLSLYAYCTSVHNQRNQVQGHGSNQPIKKATASYQEHSALVSSPHKRHQPEVVSDHQQSNTKQDDGPVCRCVSVTGRSTHRSESVKAIGSTCQRILRITRS